MATSIYQKRFIARRKEQGLCIDCGKELDRDGIRCVECNAKHNDRNNTDRKWYKENKICPICRIETLFGDEKSCPECRSKSYEIVMRSRNRLGLEHYNSIQSEWKKKEHRKRIEQGICTRCGKRNAEQGYKTCGICRAKTRNYKRIKYGKPDRNERYMQGLCYFCDNPIKIGYKVCEYHYQKNVEYANCENAKIARKELEKTVLY